MSHEVALVGPALGLSAPDTVAVLKTAALAPSVHNAQPWAFRTAPDVVELYADATRRMPVADPDDQELPAGLRRRPVQPPARAAGARCPPGGRAVTRSRPGATWSARIRSAGTARATPELTRLLDAVPRRHTNRRPFTDAAVTGAPSASRCAGPPPTRGRCFTSCRPPAGRGRPALGRGAPQPAGQSGVPRRAAPLDRNHGRTGPTALPPARPGPHRLRTTTRWCATSPGGTARDAGAGPRRRGGAAARPADPARDRPSRGRPRGRGDAAGAAHRDHGGPGGGVPLASGGGPRGARRAGGAGFVRAVHPPVAVLRIGRGWPTTRTPRRPLADLSPPLGPRGLKKLHRDVPGPHGRVRDVRCGRPPDRGVDQHSGGVR